MGSWRTWLLRQGEGDMYSEDTGEERSEEEGKFLLAHVSYLYAMLC